jgi:hypothetical protein
MLAGSGVDLFQNRMGAGAPQMPGSTADLNADQRNSQQVFRDLAARFNTDLIDPTKKMQGKFYENAQDPFSNPALKAMMEQNAQNINQAASDPGGVWSQIRANANEANQFGSSRQGIAEGIAAGRIADSITEGNTNLLNNAYNKNQDTALGAMNYTDMLAKLSTMPGQLLSAVGQQGYDQETRKLEDNLNRWRFSYEQPERAMEMLAGIFNTGLPTGTGTSSTGTSDQTGTQTTEGTNTTNTTGTSTGTNTGTNTSTTTMPQWYIDMMQQQGQGGEGNNWLAAILGVLGLGSALKP